MLLLSSISLTHSSGSSLGKCAKNRRNVSGAGSNPRFQLLTVATLTSSPVANAALIPESLLSRSQLLNCSANALLIRAKDITPSGS